MVGSKFFWPQQDLHRAEGSIVRIPSVSWSHVMPLAHNDPPGDAIVIAFWWSFYRSAEICNKCNGQNTYSKTNLLHGLQFSCSGVCGVSMRSRWRWRQAEGTLRSRLWLGSRNYFHFFRWLRFLSSSCCCCSCCCCYSTLYMYMYAFPRASSTHSLELQKTASGKGVGREGEHGAASRLWQRCR